MTKKLNEAKQKVDRTKYYVLTEAITLAKEIAFGKFDETMDIVVSLGVDPKKSDQMVRGASSLPHGTGKKVKVLVFAKGEKEAEAIAAGADFVGSDELIEKIKGGWLEFDKAIATPDMMGTVGKLGRILGPRGLMPNPKVGTVTFDVGKAVNELRAGKVEFRVDKGGLVHVPIGKVSFDIQSLVDNAMTVLEAINKAKPSASKGKYLKKMSLSTTFGPGIRVNLQELAVNLKK
jgi:large subunit ribosomal protein L1